MKRRSFIQRMGLGTGGVILSNTVKAKSFRPFSPVDFSVNSYEDLICKDGSVMLRLNYTSTDPQIAQEHSGKFNVKKGKLEAIKSYFFHGDSDDLDPTLPGMKTESYPGSVDVIVLWIKKGSDETSITFPLGNKSKSLTIAEIIEAKDATITEGTAKVIVSYLLDKEIGELDPADVGIKDQGDVFSFTAMADPQGGNPFSHETITTRMRIHNAFIDESVRVVNELEQKPAFNVVIGDIVDGQGHQDDFRAMNDMLEKVGVPTIYELGNHETKYKSTFTPGYNMSAFENYFAAQKEFNGMDKLLYSFNLGKWHFVVWPDPLRSNFWETHPHYFDWLEKDLKKYSNKPTLFFQHVPIHPIGILPLINYAESVDVKRTLLDILSKHGNVKYVLSGHVHIPMKASVKTSVEYKGIKFINLPAAGYRPRGFGEEDFGGGPTQGIAIVDINGEEAKIHYKNVTNEQFTYPKPKPFNENEYPLWLKHKWQLAISHDLKNGDFSESLKHWHQRFVYKEDIHPSNICESRNDETGRSHIYLFNKSRGYNIPGQDRLPQSNNRICQVLRQTPGATPLIKLSYWIDPKDYIKENKAGAFIWIEGFEKGLKRVNVVYSNDYINWNLGGNYSQIRTVAPVHMDITVPPGEWRELVLNPYNDFLTNSEKQNHNLQNIDTLAINLGVWTLNEGFKRISGAGFTNISLKSSTLIQLDKINSTNNGNFIQKKDKKFLLFGGIMHTAGEHQAEVDDLNKYLT
jgi:3',5'-cyclic AMP phosphodiesterase CpdA